MVQRPAPVWVIRATLRIGTLRLEIWARDKHLISDMPFGEQSPDYTMLFAAEGRSGPTPYRRGIIGRLDLTLNPMAPPGSIIQIDRQVRIGPELGMVDVDPSPAFACLQPEMEVPDRSRKPGTGHRCHDSVEIMNLACSTSFRTSNTVVVSGYNVCCVR
jgi:hypothetical protein